MSSYFVSKTEIDLLITAALAWGGNGRYGFRFHVMGSTMPVHVLEPGSATEYGHMLWRANWDETEEWATPADRSIPEMPPYEYEAVPGTINSLVVLRTISHYLYQTAGDSPDVFEFTPTFAFCQALQTVAVGQLPGIREAPWGIENRDRDIFTRSDASS